MLEGFFNLVKIKWLMYIIMKVEWKLDFFFLLIYSFG